VRAGALVSPRVSPCPGELALRTGRGLDVAQHVRAGSPSERLKYVFNGDFVDRGAWGVELLLALLAWRLAAPENVTLLRGNHESRYCTMAYGFHAELQAKYGRSSGGTLYTSCLSLFAVLPLAATVDRTVLVMHGGLFRQPAARTRGGTRARGARQAAAGAAAGAALCVGTLDDLRAASSGGPDPDGTGASVLAADVLWSDPMLESGMRCVLVMLRSQCRLACGSPPTCTAANAWAASGLGPAGRTMREGWGCGLGLMSHRHFLVATA
jgi:hypothetical protein